MKLNILPPIPAAKAPPCAKMEVPNYNSPLGWWQVTTEGDCEERTTKHLGKHYGHVAEIALFLADKCFYTLNFVPRLGEKPSERPIYRATRKSVWISLGIGSKTWGMNHAERATWIAQWMDANKDIQVWQNDGRSWYFAGVYITMR